MDLSSASLLAYQPQINSWEGNQLDFRAAVAIRPTGAASETFGTFFATARTQVDRVARTVVLENVAIYRSDFALLPDRGSRYAAELGQRIASDLRTISLDRMEVALAAADVKAPPVEVNNEPPHVLVAERPALLVPIDGAPVLKPVPQTTRFQRVVNTRALLLKGGLEGSYHLHLYDGWVTAASLAGPWSVAAPGPLEKRDFDAIAADLSTTNVVDMLDGGPKANPKPSLASGAPLVFTTQGPAELSVFKGKPNFVPIDGTRLLWASNTHSDVLIDTRTSLYHVLLAGRWFRAPAMTGPWTYVAHDALPSDFARIPPASPAGVVLPSVAGTPQAPAAVIANTIPQTATVPRSNGPTLPRDACSASASVDGGVVHESVVSRGYSPRTENPSRKSTSWSRAANTALASRN